MSRTSRIPYHQNVYDLIGVLGWEASPRETRMYDEWEQDTGLRFPDSLREAYALALHLEGNFIASLDERPTLGALWRFAEVDHSVMRLGDVLQHLPELHAGYLEQPAAPGIYFWIVAETQGCWQMYAQHDGSDDPSVYVTAWCFLDADEAFPLKWHSVGSFSNVLARSFVQASGIPGRPPWGQWTEWDTSPLLEFVPVAYTNGLWLRTPAEPFEPAVIDYLAEQFDEPERTPRPGNVTTYTFRPPGGSIRVTADEPGLAGGLSAWWMHADTPQRLAELARLILPFGTLREALRADTEPARGVLELIRA
jgi:hypothetical protein